MPILDVLFAGGDDDIPRVTYHESSAWMVGSALPIGVLLPFPISVTLAALSVVSHEPEKNLAKTVLLYVADISSAITPTYVR